MDLLHKYGRLIQQNINQINYLEDLIRSAPELELTIPASLNIVCFRYIGSDPENTKLDALNKHIEIELQEKGIAVLSVTLLNNKTVLRVANTNHRTKREDFDILIKEIIKIGKTGL